MVEPLKRFIEKHPVFFGAMSFLVVLFPQWFEAVWALFADKPFFQVLSKNLPGSFVMPPIPLYWITIPIGFLMFVYVIYLTRHQQSSESAISQAPADEVLERGYLDFFLDGREALKNITGITLKIGKQNTIATNKMGKNQSTNQNMARTRNWNQPNQEGLQHLSAHSEVHRYLV